MQRLGTKQEQKYTDIRIAGKRGFYKTLIKRIFSDPDYLFLVGKIFKIKVLKQKTPIFAIVDINNICNLKCKHCYWWLNRDDKKMNFLQMTGKK